jgi:hypothetical protein
VSSGMQARALQSHGIRVALVARNGPKLCERELAAVSRCPLLCIIVLSAWQQGIGILVEGATFCEETIFRCVWRVHAQYQTLKRLWSF